jgi:hypothetical protein
MVIPRPNPSGQALGNGNVFFGSDGCAPDGIQISTFCTNMTNLTRFVLKSNFLGYFVCGPMRLPAVPVMCAGGGFTLPLAGERDGGNLERIKRHGADAGTGV